MRTHGHHSTQSSETTDHTDETAESGIPDIAVGELDTQVGRLALACTSVGLAAVGWGSAATLAARLALPLTQEPARLTDVLTALGHYFHGRSGDLAISVDWRLTHGVQRTVLHTLHHTVGYGQSITYGELARRCDDTVPARAIGGIMGSNPLPIVVPCHRVLAHDGLGGYSGGGGSAEAGLATKRWLLALEGALPPTLDWSLQHGPAGTMPAAVPEHEQTAPRDVFPATTAVPGREQQHARVVRGWENERDE